MVPEYRSREREEYLGSLLATLRLLMRDHSLLRHGSRGRGRGLAVVISEPRNSERRPMPLAETWMTDSIGTRCPFHGHHGDT